MLDDLFPWLFWPGAVVIAYSAIIASVRYVYHWRRGARTMAAQALLQTALSMFGLIAFWLIHRNFMPG